ARLFHWYYPDAAADSAMSRPIAADGVLTAADVAEARQLSAGAPAEPEPDPLDRLLADLDDPAPAEAPAPPSNSPDLLDRLLADLDDPAPGEQPPASPAPAPLPLRPPLPLCPGTDRSIASGNATRATPALRVATHPIVTTTGQLAMFE
ncbi:MAG: hypothetical protein KKA73_22075, partial [Chloroflexi bacterium]|nr:hypothetical protein [Chloroflexota bacterium]